MPNEIRITNFRDFVEKVQMLEADTYRHRYVFRGEGKYPGFEKWKLTPKIFRQMKDSCGDKQIYRESDLIDAVISRYPNIFKECKSNLEILLLMQHYGLPTRLLDISFNPYIALFFALSGDSSIKEHYVYVIDTEKINEENNKSESKLGARQNKGWDAQKSVFDNTVAVIAALSRLSTAEQDEIKNLKNKVREIVNEIEKSIIYDNNKEVKKSKRFSISISDSYNYYDTRTNFYQDIDEKRNAKTENEKSKPMPVVREYIMSNSKFNFDITLDIDLLEKSKLEIKNIDNLISSLENSVTYLINVLEDKNSPQTENLILGANTGFLQKTIVYALFEDKKERLEVIKKLLHKGSKNAIGNHLNDKFSPRILNRIKINGKNQLAGLVRIEKVDEKNVGTN